MRRLIYVSDRAADLADAAIERLVAQAAAANLAKGVTGVLLTGPDWFVQMLEGAPEAVEPLYARIESDPRHSGVTLVERREIEAPLCAAWGMVLLLDPKEVALILERVLHRIGPFHPRQVTAQCLVLIVMAAAQRAQCRSAEASRGCVTLA